MKMGLFDNPPQSLPQRLKKVFVATGLLLMSGLLLDTVSAVALAWRENRHKRDLASRLQHKGRFRVQLIGEKHPE